LKAKMSRFVYFCAFNNQFELKTHQNCIGNQIFYL